MPRHCCWHACAPLLAVILPHLAAAGLSGCVGTIAGVPSHPPSDGSSAFGAQLSGALAASYDPANPGNLYMTLADRLILVDRNKTISRIAGGKPAPPASTTIAADASLANPIVSVGPAGEVIIAEAASIRRFFPATAQLGILAGDPVTGRGWSPDGTLGSRAQVGWGGGYTPDCLTACQRCVHPYAGLADLPSRRLRWRRLLL